MTNEEKPIIGFLLYCKPISVNHYLHSNRSGRKYLSVEAKEFQKILKAKLVDYISDQRVIKLFDNKELTVCINLGFGDNRRRDIDNYSKMILDGMQGVFFKDDSQIVRLELNKIQPVPKAYIEVEVGIR